MLSEKLNVLLSSLQVFYQNLKGFHWNVKGDMFFEMHKLYQEMYEWADDKIDVVAELILSIEGNPMVYFSDYLSHSTIEQVIHSDPKVIGSYILSDLISLSQCINEAHAISESLENRPLCMALTEIQEKLQKWFWMFKAYLG